MTIFENNAFLETPNISKTSSGLTVAVIKVTGMQRKVALLWSPLGSMIKEINVEGENISIPAGTAHFLEHKLFESENGANVFEDFADIGASCNAYTSFSGTNFTFSTTGDIYQPLEILIKFVQSLYLSEESILNEKKIIEQEISMYNDHPGWRAFFNLLQGMYHVHPVRDDVAGCVNSLNLITKDILCRCHDIFYHPQRLVLVVAGDVDVERIKEIAETSGHISNIARAKDYNIIVPKEPKNINKTLLKEYHSVTESILYMGFKLNHFPEDGAELLKREILYSLLLDTLFGAGSKAFYELYDEGLVDDSFGASFSGKFDFAHIIIGSRTKSPDILKERLLTIFKETRLVGLNEEDISRAKRKLWGAYLASLNSLEVLAGQFIKDYRLGLQNTDHFKIINNLKKADFAKILEIDLSDNNICYSLIEPLIEGV